MNQYKESEVCIIHHETSQDGDKIIGLKDYESWKTLLDAAKVRNYAPITDVAKDLGEKEVPSIQYHRKCRSLFTMKRELETLKRKATENITEEAGENSLPKRPSRSSDEGRVYLPICIFCNKDKFIKGSKSREKLTQAVTLNADQTLRECATQKRDEKILAITSRDVVAAEAHYHRSCYKDYTRINRKEPKNQDNNIGTDGDDEYKRIEREAYKDLFIYIRTDIIPNKKVVQVTSLLTNLTSFMLSGGVTSLRDSTKKNIRRTLENELGNSVDIFPDDHAKLLLVPQTVSRRDLVLENQNLLRELNIWRAKSTNVNKIIDQTSSHIRTIIKQKMTVTPWPFHPSDVKDSGYITLPDQLERLLIGLLTGNPETKTQTQKITALVQSFSQDIIYAVTGGQHKTPKQILLTYAVKTLTGNTELIQTLNKLGHGVSYSQLEENDTALCLQKLATASNQRVVLPASIKPHVFTNLAWDNIDRLEETLTGKGTSHRVNGIVVQANVYGPHLPSTDLPHIEKRKQRSVTTEEQGLEIYVAGEQV